MLAAMGLPLEWSLGSLRLILGRANNELYVDRVLEMLPGIVARLRASG